MNSRVSLHLALAVAAISAGGFGPTAAATPLKMADLKPASVSTSVSERPVGALLEVRDKIANVGAATARPSTVRYLLSVDRRASARDVRLRGTRRVRRLPRHRASRGRTRVRIPQDARPGRYHLLACADARRRVREQRERNNCRPARRRLTVTAALAPVIGSEAAPPLAPTPAPAPSPPPPPPPPPVVAAAGDIACDPADPAYNGGEGTATECRQKQVSNLLGGATRVLPLGDNQYDQGTLEQFNAAYDPTWGRFKSISRPAIGNHEYADPAGGAKGYFDYFNGLGNVTGPAGERTKGFYSFDVGAWHLVALNSNCSKTSCAEGSAQETWLRSDLAAHPARCTLAFWHHPRFSSALSGNVHWAEQPAVAPLWKALSDHGAELALTGHAHQYERFARQTELGAPDANGLRQFVVGTGGQEHHPFGASGTYPLSEFRDATRFGVLKLTLRADSFDWRFVAEDGTSVDTGSESCH